MAEDTIEARVWAAALVPTERNERRVAFVFERTVTVVAGRGRDTELMLVDERELNYAQTIMSRRHLSLAWDDKRPAELAVDDLQSKGGTYINKRATDSGIVRAGEVLRVGRKQWVESERGIHSCLEAREFAYCFCVDWTAPPDLAVHVVSSESLLPFLHPNEAHKLPPGPLPAAERDRLLADVVGGGSAPLPPPGLPGRGAGTDGPGGGRGAEPPPGTEPPPKRVCVAEEDVREMTQECMCAVCVSLMVDPVALPCQHHLCAACAREALALGGPPRCPSCRERLVARPVPARALRATVAFLEDALPAQDRAERAEAEAARREGEWAREAASIERINDALAAARGSRVADPSDCPSVFDRWGKDLQARVLGRLAVMRGAARVRYFELIDFTADRLFACSDSRDSLLTAAENLGIGDARGLAVRELYGALDTMLWIAGAPPASVSK